MCVCVCLLCTAQQLVFSDEFNSYPGGLLGTPGDLRWTAMDFHYSRCAQLSLS